MTPIRWTDRDNPFDLLLQPKGEGWFGACVREIARIHRKIEDFWEGYRKQVLAADGEVPEDYVFVFGYAQIMRNPVIPAIMVFAWESVIGFLPALLKKFSVLFYLQALFPVNISEGPIEIISEPVPLWVGVPGFILFSGLMLVAAGLQIRRMEVHYAED